MSDILETVIVLKDQYTSTAKKVASSMDALADSSDSMASSVDRAEGELSKLHKIWGKIGGKKKVEVQPVNLSAVNSSVSKLESQLSALTGRKVSINATAKVDRNQIKSAKEEVAALKYQLEQITGRKYDVDIDIEGAETGGIVSRLTGGAGIAGAAKTAAKGGILAAGAAAVGGITSMFTSGSERQQYRNNMQFFLGDEGQADAMMEWASANAAATQFSSSEVMGATSRAIQVAGGDTSEAKRFVQLAEDMASLTPGKTISDAMEALADAQMGEFERMKEFGFKGSAESFEAAGGDFWAMKDTSGSGKTIEEMFSGGTAAGAQSAAAKIGTITGNFEDAVGAVGEKLLNNLSPALDWLIEKSEGVGNAIGPIADTLGGVFMSLWTAAQPLAPILSAVAGVVGGVVKTAFTAIASFITGFVAPAFEMVASTVSAIAAPAIEKLGEISEWVSDKVKWLGDKANEVASKFQEITGAVTDAVNSLKGMGSRVTGAITSGLSSVWSSVTSSLGIGKNAQGTVAFEGGLTQMNENARGEVVALPNGARIYPYATTKNIIRDELKNASLGGGNSYSFNVNVNAQGSNMTKQQIKRLKDEIVNSIVEAIDNTVPA